MNETGDDRTGTAGVVVTAFAQRTAAPEHASVQVEGDGLMVDGWWPAALWLGPSTCLVRIDECPSDGVGAALATALTEVGLVPVEVEMAAPLQAIAVGRLGVLGAEWRVWSSGEAIAAAAIAAAASA